MNNYSWLQKKLHNVALSSKFMREIAFEIENSFISSKESLDNNVFITGLARSGTTILLNAIHQSDEFASLSYEDMPFVLAPNLWSTLSSSSKDIIKTERSHGDGIMISLESPEAFEEVFWKTFSDKKNDSNEKFKIYTNLINHKYQKNRYLSKNNQNIKRIKLISKIFPKSRIFIPFRNPIQQAYSLLVQHRRFIEASKKDKFVSDYMGLLGHTEFGPKYIPQFKNNIKFENDFEINHWIEQWILIYKNCLTDFEDNNSVEFICYEELCRSKNYWSKILETLGISYYDFDFKESKAQILLDLDEDITEQALNLYSKIF